MNIGQPLGGLPFCFLWTRKTLFEIEKKLKKEWGKVRNKRGKAYGQNNLMLHIDT